MTDMADVTIRDYQTDDEEAVISLWHETGLYRPWNHPVLDINRKSTELERGGTGAFWVAEKQGVIIGSVMVGYDGHRGVVNYLAVRPSYQGQGVGAELMKRAERLLFDAGCPKINLLVRPDNHAITSFYHAIGYGEDEVVALSKRLQEDPE